MKILLIHTYYVQRGGEDAVFEQELALLKQAGIVETIYFQNKAGLRGAFQFLAGIWNRVAARKLKKRIRDWEPDIIHIHNWHFAAGPLVVRMAGQAKCPLVITLHNYRLLCPSATLLHKGKLFTNSLQVDFPWKAVWKGTYRNSRLQSFWLAFTNWWHGKIGTWNKVDQYLVLTEFAAGIFVQSGKPYFTNKVAVKPNFCKPGKPELKHREKHFFFAGRLSEEKGIRMLLQAFSEIDQSIIIAGDGPLMSEVKNYAEKFPNIKYVGKLTEEELRMHLRSCSALVFPSIWYEGMPMTILEAFSEGCPVIASNLGAPSEMIRHGVNGLHFEPDNAASLMNMIQYWENLGFEEKYEIRKAAHNEYLQSYTPELNCKMLLSIYSNLLTNRSHQQGKSYNHESSASIKH